MKTIQEIREGMILERKKPIQKKTSIGTRFVHNFLICKKRTLVRNGLYEIDFLVAPIENDFGSNVIRESLCEFMTEEEIIRKFKIIGMIEKTFF
jgi:hypothetical protein